MKFNPSLDEKQDKWTLLCEIYFSSQWGKFYNCGDLKLRFLNAQIKLKAKKSLAQINQCGKWQIPAYAAGFPFLLKQKVLNANFHPRKSAKRA